MLLVEPPQRFEHADINLATFEFADYCDRYERAVLHQSPETLSVILRGLQFGLDGIPVSSRTVRVLAQRELENEHGVPITKVARLVVLCALANTHESRGLRIDTGTAELLAVCRDVIPVYLKLAIRSEPAATSHDSPAERFERRKAL